MGRFRVAKRIMALVLVVFMFFSSDILAVLASGLDFSDTEGDGPGGEISGDGSGEGSGEGSGSGEQGDGSGGGETSREVIFVFEDEDGLIVYINEKVLLGGVDTEKLLLEGVWAFYTAGGGDGSDTGGGDGSDDGTGGGSLDDGSGIGSGGSGTDGSDSSGTGDGGIDGSGIGSGDGSGTGDSGISSSRGEIPDETPPGTGGSLGGDSGDSSVNGTGDSSSTESGGSGSGTDTGTGDGSGTGSGDGTDTGTGSSGTDVTGGSGNGTDTGTGDGSGTGSGDGTDTGTGGSTNTDTQDLTALISISDDGGFSDYINKLTQAVTSGDGSGVGGDDSLGSGADTDGGSSGGDSGGGFVGISGTSGSVGGFGDGGFVGISGASGSIGGSDGGSFDGGTDGTDSNTGGSDGGISYDFETHVTYSVQNPESGETETSAPRLVRVLFAPFSEASTPPSVIIEAVKNNVSFGGPEVDKLGTTVSSELGLIYGQWDYVIDFTYFTRVTIDTQGPGKNRVITLEAPEGMRFVRLDSGGTGQTGIAGVTNRYPAYSAALDGSVSYASGVNMGGRLEILLADDVVGTPSFDIPTINATSTTASQTATALSVGRSIYERGIEEVAKQKADPGYTMEAITSQTKLWFNTSRGVYQSQDAADPIIYGSGNTAVTNRANLAYWSGGWSGVAETSEQNLPDDEDQEAMSLEMNYKVYETERFNGLYALGAASSTATGNTNPDPWFTYSKTLYMTGYGRIVLPHRLLDLENSSGIENPIWHSTNQLWDTDHAVYTGDRYNGQLVAWYLLDTTFTHKLDQYLKNNGEDTENSKSSYQRNPYWNLSVKVYIPEGMLVTNRDYIPRIQNDEFGRYILFTDVDLDPDNAHNIAKFQSPIQGFMHFNHYSVNTSGEPYNSDYKKVSAAGVVSTLTSGSPFGIRLGLIADPLAHPDGKYDPGRVYTAPRQTEVTYWTYDKDGQAELVTLQLNPPRVETADFVEIDTYAFTAASATSTFFSANAGWRGNTRLDTSTTNISLSNGRATANTETTYAAAATANNGFNVNDQHIGGSIVFTPDLFTVNTTNSPGYHATNYPQIETTAVSGIGKAPSAYSLTGIYIEASGTSAIRRFEHGGITHHNSSSGSLTSVPHGLPASTKISYTLKDGTEYELTRSDTVELMVWDDDEEMQILTAVPAITVDQDYTLIPGDFVTETLNRTGGRITHVYFPEASWDNPVSEVVFTLTDGLNVLTGQQYTFGFDLEVFDSDTLSFKNVPINPGGDYYTGIGIALNKKGDTSNIFPTGRYRVQNFYIQSPVDTLVMQAQGGPWILAYDTVANEIILGTAEGTVGILPNIENPRANANGTVPLLDGIGPSDSDFFSGSALLPYTSSRSAAIAFGYHDPAAPTVDQVPRPATWPVYDNFRLELGNESEAEQRYLETIAAFRLFGTFYKGAVITYNVKSNTDPFMDEERTVLLEDTAILPEPGSDDRTQARSTSSAIIDLELAPGEYLTSFVFEAELFKVGDVNFTASASSRFPAAPAAATGIRWLKGTWDAYNTTGTTAGAHIAFHSHRDQNFRSDGKPIPDAVRDFYDMSFYDELLGEAKYDPGDNALNIFKLTATATGNIDGIPALKEIDLNTGKTVEGANAEDGRSALQTVNGALPIIFRKTTSVAVYNPFPTVSGIPAAASGVSQGGEFNVTINSPAGRTGSTNFWANYRNSYLWLKINENFSYVSSTSDLVRRFTVIGEDGAEETWLVIKESPTIPADGKPANTDGLLRRTVTTAYTIRLMTMPAAPPGNSKVIDELYRTFDWGGDTSDPGNVHSRDYGLNNTYNNYRFNSMTPSAAYLPSGWSAVPEELNNANSGVIGGISITDYNKGSNVASFTGEPKDDEVVVYSWNPIETSIRLAAMDGVILYPGLDASYLHYTSTRDWRDDYKERLSAYATIGNMGVSELSDFETIFTLPTKDKAVSHTAATVKGVAGQTSSTPDYGLSLRRAVRLSGVPEGWSDGEEYTLEYLPAGEDESDGWLTADDVEDSAYGWDDITNVRLTIPTFPAGSVYAAYFSLSCDDDPSDLTASGTAPASHTLSMLTARVTHRGRVLLDNPYTLTNPAVFRYDAYRIASSGATSGYAFLDGSGNGSYAASETNDVKIGSDIMTVELWQTDAGGTPTGDKPIAQSGANYDGTWSFSDHLSGYYKVRYVLNDNPDINWNDWVELLPPDAAFALNTSHVDADGYSPVFTVGGLSDAAVPYNAGYKIIEYEITFDVNNADALYKDGEADGELTVTVSCFDAVSDPVALPRRDDFAPETPSGTPTYVGGFHKDSDFGTAGYTGDDTAGAWLFFGDSFILNDPDMLDYLFPSRASGNSADRAVKLYAIWIEGYPNIALYYDANGGDGSVPAPRGGYTAEETLTLADNTGSPPLSRHGYTWQGWSRDKAATAGDSSITFTEDDDTEDGVTVYAVWEADEFTITYDLGDPAAPGGEGTNGDGNPEEYNISDTIITDDGEGNITGGIIFKPPTRDGYTFKGWVVSDADDNIIALSGGDGEYRFGGEDGFIGDITVTALWDANTYTVSFDPNFDAEGGTGAMDDIFITFGEKITIPPNAFLSYNPAISFHFWYTNNSGIGGQTLANGDVYAIAGDTTLYAIWKEAAYTIVFDPNGGTGTMENVYVHDYDYPAELTENEFSRTGYTFSGWNTHCDGTGEPFADKASFTLDPTDADDYALFDDDSCRRLTLYAMWTEKSSFSLTFDTGEDGIFDPDDPKNTSDEENLSTWTVSGLKWTQDGLDSGVPAPLSKYKGYYFNGWYTYDPINGDLLYLTEDTAYSDLAVFDTTSSVTVNAEWLEMDDFTVVFYSDSSLEIARKTGVRWTQTGLLAEVSYPARVGYLFAGWNTDPGGAGISPGDLNSYGELADGDDGQKSVSIYATWIEKSDYTVIYDTGADGSVVDPKESVLWQEAGLTPALDPTYLPGFTFGGWYTRPDGDGDRVTELTSYADLAEGDDTLYTVTLYAFWVELGGYTLNFNLDLFNTHTQKTDLAWTQAGLLSGVSSPSRSGYVFAGWFSEPDGKGDEITSLTAYSVIAGDDDKLTSSTVYAKWTPITYTVNFDYNVAGEMEDMGSYEQEGTLGESLDLPLPKDLSNPGHILIGFHPDPEYVYNHLDENYDPDAEKYLFNGKAFTLDSSILGIFKENSETDFEVTLYAIWHYVEPRIILTYDANGGSGRLPLPSDGYMSAGWVEALDEEHPTFAVLPTIAETSPPLIKRGFSFIGWAREGSDPGTFGALLDGRIDFENSDMGVTDPLGIEGEVTVDGKIIDLTIKSIEIVVYAQWEIAEYAIAYNYDEGSAPAGGNPEKYSLYEIGSEDSPALTETSINPPTRKGFVFSGWTIRQGGVDGTIIDRFTVTDGIGGDIYTLQNRDGDLHFAALWTPDKFTVSFSHGVSNDGLSEGDAGYASGTMADVSVTYGDGILLPRAGFTRPGYIFAGWSTDGSDTVTYSDREGIAAGMIDDDLTLTAVWKERDYSITYWLRRGTNDPATPTANFKLSELTDGSGIVVITPTRDNHDFDGWTVTSVSTFGAVMPIETQARPADETAPGAWDYKLPELPTGAGYPTYDTLAGYRLVAAWTAHTYTVTFDPGASAGDYDHESGSGALTQTVAYGGYPAVPVVTRDGYRFRGWFIKGSDYAGDSYPLNTPVAGAAEFIAVWDKIDDDGHDVFGTILDENLNELEKVTVQLWQGDTLISQVGPTDESGKFCFGDVHPGLYNIVVIFERTVVVDIEREELDYTEQIVRTFYIEVTFDEGDPSKGYDLGNLIIYTGGGGRKNTQLIIREPATIKDDVETISSNIVVGGLNALMDDPAAIARVSSGGRSGLQGVSQDEINSVIYNNGAILLNLYSRGFCENSPIKALETAAQTLVSAVDSALNSSSEDKTVKWEAKLFLDFVMRKYIWNDVRNFSRDGAGADVTELLSELARNVDIYVPLADSALAEHGDKVVVFRLHNGSVEQLPKGAGNQNAFGEYFDYNASTQTIHLHVGRFSEFAFVIPVAQSVTPPPGGGTEPGGDTESGDEADPGELGDDEDDEILPGDGSDLSPTPAPTPESTTPAPPREPTPAPTSDLSPGDDPGDGSGDEPGGELPGDGERISVIDPPVLDPSGDPAAPDVTVPPGDGSDGAGDDIHPPRFARVFISVLGGVITLGITDDDLLVLAIGDFEIPLAAWPNKDSGVAPAAWALINLLLCIAGGFYALSAAFLIFRRRYIKDWLLATIAAAMLGIILFLFTENMRNPMILVDFWTLSNLLLFVFCVVSARLAFKQTARERERVPEPPDDSIPPSPE